MGPFKTTFAHSPLESSPTPRGVPVAQVCTSGHREFRQEQDTISVFQEFTAGEGDALQARHPR